MKKTLKLLGVVAVIIISLVAISQLRKPKGHAPTTTQIWKQSGVPVEAVTLQRGNMNNTVSVTGDLTALNAAVISSKISGRLTAVNVHEGDVVSQGQVLAVIDQGDSINAVEAAQANLESAKARLAQAVTNAKVSKITTDSAIQQANYSLKSALAKLEVVKRPTRTQERMVAENKAAASKANLDKAEADYKRNERLLKRGAISESAFDVYKTAYVVAQSDYKSAKDNLSLIDEGGRREDIASNQAQVEVARQQVLQAKANESQNLIKQRDVEAARAVVMQAQASVDTAKRQLDNTYIRAAISGVVSTKSADPGQVVSPGQNLGMIVDLNSIYFKGDVSEKYLTSITPGQNVLVTLEALQGQSLVGRVTKINPAGSTSSRNFSVQINLVNANGKIRPGMFASGDITIGINKDVLLLPKAALDERNGVKAAFSVGKDNKANRHLVTTVAEDRLFYQIQEQSGLKQGDQVITEGHVNVEDGTLVDINKTKAEADNVVN